MFALHRRYRGDFPVFSDDIQGIAAVVIAGLIAAQPLTGKRLSEHTYLFAGEGRGATATAEASTRTVHIAAAAVAIGVSSSIAM